MQYQHEQRTFTPPVNYQPSTPFSHGTHTYYPTTEPSPSRNMSAGWRQDQPNILFVGNLSYFCEVSHLFDLFNEYGRVNGVRMVRNDNRTRPLMFGFVTMSTAHEASEMERILNGSFFMGRRLRVAISGRRDETREDLEGIQVYVSFTSSFPKDKVKPPTEGWLRRVFVEYGVILDCSVKEYQEHKTMDKQEGYGFISFRSYDDALHVIKVCRSVTIEGITLTCSLSNWIHPHDHSANDQPLHPMVGHNIPQQSLHYPPNGGYYNPHIFPAVPTGHPMLVPPMPGPYGDTIVLYPPPNIGVVPYPLPVSLATPTTGRPSSMTMRSPETQS